MTELLKYIFNEIKLIVLYVFEQVLMAFVALLEAIPVPGFLLNVSSYQLPSNILYFLGVAQFGTGVSIMVTAYTLRFLIRRLPVVG